MEKVSQKVTEDCSNDEPLKRVVNIIVPFSEIVEKVPFSEIVEKVNNESVIENCSNKEPQHYHYDWHAAYSFVFSIGSSAEFTLARKRWRKLN